MHDEYTIKPGGCQPLVDWGTNGKPRPWRKHHIEGLMLSEIYDALALAAMPPDDQLEPAGSALGAAIDAKLGLSTTPDGIQYNAETGEIIECSTERKLPSAAAKYLDKARRLAGCAPLPNSSACRMERSISMHPAFAVSGSARCASGGALSSLGRKCGRW